MKPLMAVAQMTSTDDIESNFKFTKDLCEQAKEAGAQLLCLPENFAYLGDSFSDRGKMSETLQGPLFSRYRQLAAKYSIIVSFGGFQEKDSEGRHFNSHIIVNNAGDICSVYRKLHLFKAILEGHKTLDESLNCDAGDEVVIADVGFAKLGLSICYDLRFAELYRALTDLSADILLVPAAFTVPTGQAHWEVLLRARAIENQCYVLAAAQHGRHNSSRSSYGHAMIVDPWGQIVNECNKEKSLVFAELDLDYQKQVRKRIPVKEHRRPELFSEALKDHEQCQRTQ